MHDRRGKWSTASLSQTISLKADYVTRELPLCLYFRTRFLEGSIELAQHGECAGAVQAIGVVAF